jgi:hypothetical protein
LLNLFDMGGVSKHTKVILQHYVLEYDHENFSDRTHTRITFKPKDYSEMTPNRILTTTAWRRIDHSTGYFYKPEGFIMRGIENMPLIEYIGWSSSIETDIYFLHREEFHKLYEKTIKGNE